LVSLPASSSGLIVFTCRFITYSRYIPTIKTNVIQDKPLLRSGRKVIRNKYCSSSTTSTTIKLNGSKHKTIDWNSLSCLLSIRWAQQLSVKRFCG
jgi:hypothetical protein